MHGFPCINKDFPGHFQGFMELFCMKLFVFGWEIAGKNPIWSSCVSRKSLTLEFVIHLEYIDC